MELSCFVGEMNPGCRQPGEVEGKLKKTGLLTKKPKAKADVASKHI